MIPIEACRAFRSMPHDLVAVPFTQTQTPKGKLVHDSFRCAYKNLGNHYETNDPLAVAVAFRPDMAAEVIEKCCYVETKGKFTRGMVVLDWFEVYPQDSKVHAIPEEAINQNPRRTVKIVTKVHVQRLLDLMLESVL